MIMLIASFGRRHKASRLSCLLAGLILLHAVLIPLRAAAEEPPLDRWPAERANDLAALQRGARIFVNYCLNCHGANQMRWNRLRDIGLEEAQIKSQLILGEQKVGEIMTVAMSPRDAKNWFGKAPPDLSVIVRARNTAEHRGTDYIYTLLRSFYRDRSTLTGWNNVVYSNIAMPNILWQRQGSRTATVTHTEWEEEKTGTDGRDPVPRQLVQVTSVYDVQGNVQVTRTTLDHGTPALAVSFVPADPRAAAAVDDDVADLVAYLNWMSEPAASTRHRIGVWVIGFLVVFLLVARWMNTVFWRGIT